MKVSIELINAEKAILREAKKNDSVKLIKYLQDIAIESDFLTFGQGELEITQEIEESIIEEHMSGTNKIMLIVEYNDEIIANLNFNGGRRQRVQHTGEFGISVKREFWNNGIAEKLIENLILWAKGNDIVTKLNLRVREDNDKAISCIREWDLWKKGR